MTRTITRPLTYALACTAGLLLAGCGDDGGSATPPAQPKPPTLQNIPATASSAGLSTLVTAVTTAQLDDDLAQPGPFTVFAPTNAAFTALGPTLNSLLQPANRTTLTSILNYHVLPGSVNSTAAINAAIAGTRPATANGATVLLDRIFGSLYVNEARVVTPDVACSNGVVHVIDAVIRPPESIVSTLTARGFSTLVSAVGTAGIAGDLTGPGPLTVFAPTNAAFAAIDTAGLSPAQLADVLRYHVVAGAVRASAGIAAAEASTSVATANGRSFTPQVAGNTLRIASTTGTPARVVTYNIPCSNGIIHVIDAVLLPPPAVVARR